MANGRADVIEGATSEWDDDGFHLHIDTDEEGYDFRITDVATAKTFLSAAYRLRSWIADADEARAQYDAATPDERDRVLGMRRLDPDERLDLDEQQRHAADDARKRDRENRP